MERKLARARQIGLASLTSAHHALLTLLILLAAAIGSFACRITSPREAFTPHPQVVSTPTEETRLGVLWTRPLLIPPKSPSGRVTDAFFVQEDKVFFANPEGYPAAFHLSTGEQLWQWEDRGTIYGTEPDAVYVVREDKRLYALRISTGETKWKAVLGLEDNQWVEWPLWIGEETLHLPLSGHYILGYSFFVTIGKHDGSILWWGSGEYHADILGQTEQVLLVSIDGNREWQGGIDPLTGAGIWNLAPDAGVPVYVSGGSFLTHRQGILAAYEIDSGRQLWQSDRENINEVLALSPTRIYARYPESEDVWWITHLTALDRQTGREIWNWQHLSSDAYHFVGEAEGIAVLGHDNLGYTYGIETLSGTVLWQNDDLRLNRLVGMCENTLVGIYDNPPGPYLLYGLNPATGERKWRLELTQVIDQVIMLGDKLAYGSGQGLAILDPETGQLVSTIPLPDRPSRLVAHEDFLLVQTGTSEFYGGTGTGTLSAVRP